MDKQSVSSIRFPSPLRDRIRAQAVAEHRTFSGAVVHLVQVALTEQQHHDEHGDVDPDEIERLAHVYHQTVEGS